MNIWVATQTRYFKDESVDVCMVQNSDLYLGPQSDPGEAKRSAECMMGHFDRMKIHHEDETVSTYVSGYSEIATESESETSGFDGRGSKTKTKGKQYRPVQSERTQKRAVYEDPQHQLFWQQQHFMLQSPGKFWVKKKGHVPYKWDVPLVEDTWEFPGLARDKFEECLSRLKQSTVYEQPALIKPEIDEEVMAICSKKKPPQQNRQSKPQQNGKYQPKGANGRLSGKNRPGGNGKQRSSHS